MTEQQDTLLRVRELRTHFRTEQGTIRAVDGIDFEIRRGETFGIVGESGCGKSVTAFSIMQLIERPQGDIVGGSIEYMGEGGRPIDIAALDPNGPDMRNLRGNEIGMIFQEPMTSLNPIYTIGNQIVEAIVLHQRVNKMEARKRAIELLDRVGLSDPHSQIDDYPHQLSGGMRQRVMIAMALSCNPRLLIADEPTTALDVTVEAQILDLMRDLQQEFDMSIMLITHNLGVVAENCDRVMVMYLGKVIEEGSAVDIFYNPRHPYTRGLLASIPQIGLSSRLTPIEGAVPMMQDIPEGCYFAPRCPHVMAICENEPPMFFPTDTQRAKCWLYSDEATKQHVK
ncbi:MAG: ABC transporter ATP-binding protein [Chloroflexota bacterium]|nr:ABC transporter ATP-binding protein [Chloroflexota bacterium]